MQVISGIKDPAFREALALTRPNERAATGKYLVEGIGLVKQALHSPAPVFAVYALEEEIPFLVEACQEKDVPLYSLGAGLIAKLVGTSYETAVTAVAIVGQYLLDPHTLTLTPNTLLLVGERIQDPRNVGVLIRTAEAAGCTALILSGDSAEPFSRAAVRSTTGSILRLPLLISVNLPELLQQLRQQGARVIATSAKAPHLVYDVPLAGTPLVLVVGNETEGISEEAKAAASNFVSLPMAPNGASSLNVTVAAGVLLYEAVRQRRSL
ncbi:MAG: RNA methyltransferase [Abitibacteriaceae bacterium]|nr:RNA methyltransferase [Abditibacteriaceae bacterium]